MAAKINQNGPYLEFHCPGCGFDHAVKQCAPWTWNGSLDKPTFQPSVKYESYGNTVESKTVCHFYVEEGKIKFCTDCTAHTLSGQTLELPDWDHCMERGLDPETKEEKPMAEKQVFKPGDQVKLLAPHVSGIRAEVVIVEPNDRGCVCKITSSEHPSGHSQLGTLVMFPGEQLELLASGIPRQVEL